MNLAETDQYVTELWTLYEGDLQDTPVYKLGYVPKEGLKPGIGYITVDDSKEIFIFASLSPYITGKKEGVQNIVYPIFVVPANQCEQVDFDGTIVHRINRRYIQVISCTVVKGNDDMSLQNREGSRFAEMTAPYVAANLFQNLA